MKSALLPALIFLASVLACGGSGNEVASETPTDTAGTATTEPPVEAGTPTITVAITPTPPEVENGVPMVELRCQQTGSDGLVPLANCLTESHPTCLEIHTSTQCDVAEEFLLDHDLNPIWEYSTDMTQDDIPEIVIHAFPYGCGSCHAQEIVIMQGSVVLYDQLLDDPQITIGPSLPAVGFWIKEPVRRENAPFCCASQYLETYYEWNPSEQTFARPLDY